MPDQKSMTRNEESKSPFHSFGQPQTGNETENEGNALVKQDSKEGSVLPPGLKDVAQGVMGDAKKAVESFTDQRSKVADGLGGVAHALRQATSARHEPVIDTVRPYVEKAADQVERVSSYVQERSIRDMAGDLQNFARREPALFLGGAFVIGLVGGRFLKASEKAIEPSQAQAEPTGAGASQQRTGSRQFGQSGASSENKGSTEGTKRSQPGHNGGSQNGNGGSQKAGSQDSKQEQRGAASQDLKGEAKKDEKTVAKGDKDKSEGSSSTSSSMSDKPPLGKNAKNTGQA
jgi:hypothetical protein